MDKSKTDKHPWGLNSFMDSVVSWKTEWEWDDKLGLTVYGSVNMTGMELEIIPYKFYQVDGRFDCSDNELKTLENCPSYVRDNFDCSNNKLVTLEGCPSNCFNFVCRNNPIETYRHLKGKSFIYIYIGHKKRGDIDFDELYNKSDEYKDIMEYVDVINKIVCRDENFGLYALSSLVKAKY